MSLTFVACAVLQSPVVVGSTTVADLVVAAAAVVERPAHLTVTVGPPLATSIHQLLDSTSLLKNYLPSAGLARPSSSLCDL